MNLMPNKLLFHSRRGELMVSILLLQDLLAIFVLFLLHGASTNNGLEASDFLTALVGLPTLLFLSFMGRKLLIRPLVHYFWHMKEYVFLLAIAWCLGLAQLGEFLGLSGGIGAFIGGVSIASHSRTAALIRERLNPLRDFFLVMFFFSVLRQFRCGLSSKISTSLFYFSCAGGLAFDLPSWTRDGENVKRLNVADGLEM